MIPLRLHTYSALLHRVANALSKCSLPSQVRPERPLTNKDIKNSRLSFANDVPNLFAIARTDFAAYKY